jgi:hypothetical protein
VSGGTEQGEFLDAVPMADVSYLFCRDFETGRPAESSRRPSIQSIQQL